jgi:hypothetical protein
MFPERLLLAAGVRKRGALDIRGQSPFRVAHVARHVWCNGKIPTRPETNVSALLRSMQLTQMISHRCPAMGAIPSGLSNFDKGLYSMLSARCLSLCVEG